MTLCIWSRLFSLSPHQKYHLSLSACIEGLSLWIYGCHMGPSHVQIPYSGLLHVSHLPLLRSGKRNLFRGNKKENKRLSLLSFIVFISCHLAEGRRKKNRKVQKRWITRTEKKNRLYLRKTQTTDFLSEKLNLNSPQPWMKYTEAC